MLEGPELLRHIEAVPRLFRLWVDDAKRLDEATDGGEALAAAIALGERVAGGMIVIGEGIRRLAAVPGREAEARHAQRALNQAVGRTLREVPEAHALLMAALGAPVGPVPETARGEC